MTFTDSKLVPNEAHLGKNENQNGGGDGVEVLGAMLV